jgi:endonuclease/exonuclease/phosphatase family metal-dependent hydrolase
METLRIMSNNIWWCDGNHEVWEAQGADCSAKARAPQLVRLYKETLPDILGLQECSARMAHFLMTPMAQEGLPYALLWGRNTPIVYRRDKFELVDSEVGLYPEEVPGLEGSFNDLQTKSYCIAVLRSKEDGKNIIFASTHLWYKSDARQAGSEEAKAWQLNRLIDRLDALQSQYGCGAVVVGDFNTWPCSKAVQSAYGRGFVHGHDVVTDYADECQGMHYCYADGFKKEPYEGGFDHSIDHILLRGVNGTVRRFERYYPNYYVTVSDHFPVWVDLEV